MLLLCFKFSIIFQKYLNNNKNKIYLNLWRYHFQCSFFLCIDLYFHLIHFLSAWRASLNISWSVALVVIFLSILYNEKPLVFLSFKKYLLEIKVLLKSSPHPSPQPPQYLKMLLFLFALCPVRNTPSSVFIFICTFCMFFSSGWF